MSWLSLPIRRDADVVGVRSRARSLAAALMLAPAVRARLVTAASEFARWCLGSPNGTVTFGGDGPSGGAWIEFRASGALPSDLAVLLPRLRHATLQFVREATADDERVMLRIHIDERAGVLASADALRDLLLQGDDATAIELLREQNREMAQLLSELREKDLHLAEALDAARRSANEAAENALRLAELAHRKDEVMAIVSHDIRSPLAAVRGALALLEGSLANLDDDQKRLIAIANRAGDAIVELVSNVLTSALLDTGETGYEPAQVDIAVIGCEIAGTLGIAAAQKGVKLEALSSDSASALGDSTWVRQVVSNLVMNAIKFTERGGLVELKVRAEGAWVLLEVSDNGVGIPDEKRSQLFQKGRKLRAGGTDGERGSGLGLYITKKLVDRMNGTIEFESGEGRGTVFRVRLPAIDGA